MTRVLSELLGAREPLFSRNLRQLEILTGHPRADIRLSTEIAQDLRGKLPDLGLDAHDTTGEELYAAVGQRLKNDEIRFGTALLQHAGMADDPILHIAQILRTYTTSTTVFAIKSTVAKKLLRANLPKKTMKALGYRSVDSMVKHESAAALYAAGWLIESRQWCKRIVTAYARLGAADFEIRSLAIEQPTSKRWQEIGETIVAQQKHNVLSFKELGTVVLLPLPTRKPPLPSLTMTVLALHAINEIRAASTFLKLHQLRSNFGTIVQQVVLGEPMLPVETLDQPLSWHNLHQFFGRFEQAVRMDIFEPLVAIEELTWQPVEHVLTAIAPSLEFWHSTAHLGMLSGGQPVTLNITDALLSHCNHLGFERRVVQYFKQSLQSEILLRYLSSESLQQTVFSHLQLKLAPEMAIV